MRGFQLVRVGLLAATLGLACGPDTIDLLPRASDGGAPSSNGGATSGAATTAGQSGAPNTAGQSGAGGSPPGGSGGASGGGGSDSGGCQGFNCGGVANSPGLGGEGGGKCDGFMVPCPCDAQGRCVFGATCNPQSNVCEWRCKDPYECGTDELLCVSSVCKRCESNQQCEDYGAFGRSLCIDGRCQECNTNDDCRMDAPICDDTHCVQCRNDDDCTSGTCDFRNRCSK